jgi:hypothetical protein
VTSPALPASGFGIPSIQGQKERPVLLLASLIQKVAGNVQEGSPLTVVRA